MGRKGTMFARWIIVVALSSLVVACQPPGEETPPSAPEKPAGEPAGKPTETPVAQKEKAARQAAKPAAARAVDASPPATEYDLDDDAVEYRAQPRPRPRRQQPARSAPVRTVEVTLRSTPPDATASVDGTVIGKTPVLWRAPSDGKAHEFTFVLAGYSVARYRFVPTSNGIVHGTLKRLPVKKRKAPPKGDAAQPAP